MMSRACVFVHAANKYNSHFHHTHLSFIQFNQETFLFLHRAWMKTHGVFYLHCIGDKLIKVITQLNLTLEILCSIFRLGLLLLQRLIWSQIRQHKDGIKTVSLRPRRAHLDRWTRQHAPEKEEMLSVTSVTAHWLCRLPFDHVVIELPTSGGNKLDAFYTFKILFMLIILIKKFYFLIRSFC